MEIYKGFVIEDYWLPQYAKFTFYEIDGLEEKSFTANTIEECKEQIDEMLC